MTKIKPEIVYFDIVNDYPEMGGVCELSDRIVTLLIEKHGARIVSARRKLKELGSECSHLLYLDRERVAAEILSSAYPRSILFFPNFQSPISKADDKGWPRIINVIHDVQFMNLPELFPIPRRQWLCQTFEETRRNADHIVFISNATKNDYIRSFGHPRHHTVIYNPTGDMTLTAKSLSVNRERDFLLASFHHHPHKNVKFLISVFSEVARRISDLELILTGYRRSEFDEEVAHLDKDISKRIHWIGYVSREELNTLYKISRSYINLSRCEGFNLSAAEAACHGTRLILSDLPVHRELFSDQACFIDLSTSPHDAARIVVSFLEKDRPVSSWKLKNICDPAFAGHAYSKVIRSVSRS